MNKDATTIYANQFPKSTIYVITVPHCNNRNNVEPFLYMYVMRDGTVSALGIYQTVKSLIPLEPMSKHTNMMALLFEAIINKLQSSITKGPHLGEDVLVWFNGGFKINVWVSRPDFKLSKSPPPSSFR